MVVSRRALWTSLFLALAGPIFAGDSFRVSPYLQNLVPNAMTIQWDIVRMNSYSSLSRLRRSRIQSHAAVTKVGGKTHHRMSLMTGISLVVELEMTDDSKESRNHPNDDCQETGMKRASDSPRRQ